MRRPLNRNVWLRSFHDPMDHPWDDWPQSDGVIVAVKGRSAIVVRLQDDREVNATFPRRFGCIIGNPIGWRVRVAFRPASSKPPFIIKRYRDAHDHLEC